MTSLSDNTKQTLSSLTHTCSVTPKGLSKISSSVLLLLYNKLVNKQKMLRATAAPDDPLSRCRPASVLIVWAEGGKCQHTARGRAVTQASLAPSTTGLLSLRPALQTWTAVNGGTAGLKKC